MGLPFRTGKSGRGISIMGPPMAKATTEPTTVLEKVDRCGDLPHRPRVLLGKMGLDGHDRGVKLIARAMRDSGIHVIYSGLWQTPRSLAIAARDEDVDCIAASMMSNSHNVLVPKLIEECRNVGRPDMTINIGGIINIKEFGFLSNLDGAIKNDEGTVNNYGGTCEGCEGLGTCEGFCG